MSQSSSQRCPDCWTAFDGQPSECPACGGRLGGRRKPPRATLLAVGLLAAVAIIGIKTWTGTAVSEVEVAADPEPAPPSAPAPASPEIDPAPPAPEGSVWTLVPESPRDGPVAGLILSAPPAAEPPGYLFLPLEGFPLHGGLREPDGTALRFSVVNWSLSDGYVLLSLADAPPGLVPAIPRASRRIPEELWIAGDPEPLPVARSPDARLVLDREAPAGSVLLDSVGQAVGLTLGGTRALPVDAAIPWLGHPGLARRLDDLQHELRSADPQLVLEDVAELLENPTRQGLSQALEMLDGALARARERQTLQALEELRAAASQAYVRALRGGPESAFSEARELVARHPHHPGLIKEALLLLLSYDAAYLGQIDPYEVLDLFDRSSGLAPEDTREVADLTASRMAQVIRLRLREERYQEAIDLSAAAAGRFPRADLYMLRAQALWDSGRRQEALGSAQVASDLDPAHLPQLAAWQAMLQRDLDPDTVVIPYDPERNILTTQVTIDGHPVEFLIDTGASLTTIPSGTARSLGLVRPESPVVWVETANGRVEARRVRVSSLRIGSIGLTGVDVVVLDLPGDLQGKGLLGLNVLRPLNMSIDSANGVLMLKRPAASGRRGRRRR